MHDMKPSFFKAGSIFKRSIFIPIVALAACTNPPATGPLSRSENATKTVIAVPETTRDATSKAMTLDAYKRVLADRIASTNSIRMFVGRPQALLRSVIVVKYQIDSGGNLMRSDIMRSNRDRANESTALASLKNAGPFPKPAAHLLRNGRIDVIETWLFNNDGRFQLRTTAEPQMNE